MSEWFKEHDWKSCVGLKLTGGSNPLLCANEKAPLWVLLFVVWRRDCRIFELSEVRASRRNQFGVFFKKGLSAATLCCFATIYSSLRHERPS